MKLVFRKLETGVWVELGLGWVEFGFGLGWVGFGLRVNRDEIGFIPR